MQTTYVNSLSRAWCRDLKEHHAKLGGSTFLSMPKLARYKIYLFIYFPIWILTDQYSFFIVYFVQVSDIPLLLLLNDFSIHFGKVAWIFCRTLWLAVNPRVWHQFLWFLLSLQRAHELLVHSSECPTSRCQYPLCRMVKGHFRHSSLCKIRAAGGCCTCKEVWALIYRHSRVCKESNCNVPRCRFLHKLLSSYSHHNKLNMLLWVSDQANYLYESLSCSRCRDLKEHRLQSVNDDGVP